MEPGMGEVERVNGKGVRGETRKEPVNQRDYQDKAEDAVFREWEQHRSTVVVMATGLGKTITFAKVIKRLGRRALVIAHRRELIFQAVESIERSVGLKCAVEMANERASSDLFSHRPVVVSTVQTMSKGLERWRPDDFGLIVCDEFHHGTASTYRKIFDYFGQNPHLKILGVTATPDRADEEALSQVCDSVAFEYDIYDGVQDGWLVPVTQQFCPVSSLDLSHVRTTAGELNQGDLAKIMEAEENVQGVCQPALEVLYGMPPKTLTPIPVPEWPTFIANLNRTPRRAIVFTVSVAQAEACCSILNRVVIGIAEWICGKTPEEDRKDILDRYKRGKTPVIVNCAVLTEGFDAPATEVIFMAKPTKSRSHYTQMVGRSTRPLPGLVDGLADADARKAAIKASAKPFCRIIDFAGNSGKHKLVCALDILGGKCTGEVLERAKQKALEDGKPVAVLRQLTKAEAELEDEKRKRIEARRLAEEARRNGVVAKSHFQMVDVDPFGQQRFFASASKKALGPPATDKQKRLIGRFGINPRDLTKKKAGWIISILADNHWTLPKDYEWLRNPHSAAK